MLIVDYLVNVCDADAMCCVSIFDMLISSSKVNLGMWKCRNDLSYPALPWVVFFVRCGHVVMISAVDSDPFGMVNVN